MRRFQIAKGLLLTTELPELQKPIFEELGLLDDLPLLLELESLYAKRREALAKRKNNGR